MGNHSHMHACGCSNPYIPWTYSPTSNTISSTKFDKVDYLLLVSGLLMFCSLWNKRAPFKMFH